MSYSRKQCRLRISSTVSKLTMEIESFDEPSHIEAAKRLYQTRIREEERRLIPLVSVGYLVLPEKPDIAA